MRAFIILAIASVSNLAQAQIVAESFQWRANGQFELRTNQGSLTGGLRSNDKAQVKRGPITLDIKAYDDAFLFAVMISETDELGSAYLIERQNADYVLMHQQPIRGRKLTLLGHVEGAIEGLRKTNNWTVAQSMRAMVEYYSANAGKQAHDFMDAVETGAVRAVPRPTVNPTIRNQGVVQPQLPRSRDGGGGYYPRGEDSGMGRGGESGRPLDVRPQRRLDDDEESIAPEPPTPSRSGRDSFWLDEERENARRLREQRGVRRPQQPRTDDDFGRQQDDMWRRQQEQRRQLPPPPTRPSQRQRDPWGRDEDTGWNSRQPRRPGFDDYRPAYPSQQPDRRNFIEQLFGFPRY